MNAVVSGGKSFRLSQRQHRVYDVLISALALTAVGLIIVDCSDGLNGWQTILNRCLFAVFAADYLLRLAAAPDKRFFLRHNFCDLVAVLPFHGVFRPLRSVRLNAILKTLNLSRIFAFLCRPLKKAARFFDTNGFKYVLFVTSLIILLGGVLIHFAEGMSLGDGIWWSFVTATTVGYGDISPHSLYGRLIAMVLMLMGIGLIGSVTSTLTSYFLRTKNQTVRERTVQMVQEELEHFDELSQEDVEELCELLRTLKRKEHRPARLPESKHKTHPETFK